MGWWLEKLVDFAVRNARSVRDGWAAFVVWCIIAFVVSWYGLGQIYETRLTNAQSEIASLKTRMAVLESENRDLDQKVTSAQNKSPQMQTRDPDELYQFGEAAAQAPSGQIDRPSGIIKFPRVISGPNFNINADIEYREFKLALCRYGIYSSTKNFGIFSRQMFADVTCQIVGMHP